jgi:hypothetical protein
MEEKIAMLQALILELQKECQDLRNQLAVLKQEKQDSPHTPFQIKEKNKKKDVRECSFRLHRRMCKPIWIR